jgi:hypothetical protein
MGTPNRRRRAGGLRGRRYVGRNGLLLLIGGAVAVFIGAGIASAQDGSSRTAALSQADARSAGWPAGKAHLYREGVAKAFPIKPAAKPARSEPQPMPAPGVPVVVPAARRTGISNLRQAPFGSQDFAVQNSYSGLVKGRWYVAYAGTVGGEGASSGQGGVRVLSADASQNADTGITDIGTFPVAGTTSLKVTGYAGDSITLLANTGATYTFNLDTLSYA